MLRAAGRRGGGWVALAFLVFAVGLGGGWSLLTNQSGGQAYKCTPHTIHAGEQLPSSLVTVDVLNGGDTDGIASRVASALQARGFRQGSVANSLSSIKPTAVTILTERRSDPRVQLVAQQFAKVDFHAPDVSLGAGVTVLIGNKFTTLKPGGPRSIKANSDVSFCH